MVFWDFCCFSGCLLDFSWPLGGADQKTAAFLTLVKKKNGKKGNFAAAAVTLIGLVVHKQEAINYTAVIFKCEQAIAGLKLLVGLDRLVNVRE